MQAGTSSVQSRHQSRNLRLQAVEVGDGSRPQVLGQCDAIVDHVDGLSVWKSRKQMNGAPSLRQSIVLASTSETSTRVWSSIWGIHNRKISHQYLCPRSQLQSCSRFLVHPRPWPPPLHHAPPKMIQEVILCDGGRQTHKHARARMRFILWTKN